MTVAAKRFIFFPGEAVRKSQEGIRTLRDGRQVTDPDYLIHTPEFQEHLQEIRETIEDYVAMEAEEDESQT